MKKLILICSLGLLGSFVSAGNEAGNETIPEVSPKKIVITCEMVGNALFEYWEQQGLSSAQIIENYNSFMSSCNG